MASNGMTRWKKDLFERGLNRRSLRVQLSEQLAQMPAPAQAAFDKETWTAFVEEVIQEEGIQDPRQVRYLTA